MKIYHIPVMKYNDLGVDYRYMIVNKQDRRFGSYITTVGFQAIGENMAYPLKGHPSGYYFNVEKGRILREYQLVYISKGEGYFSTLGLKEQKIGRGTLLLLTPGQWHSYYPDVRTGWNEYYIGFEGKAIEAMFDEGFLPRENTIIEIGINEELVRLYQQAIDIGKADKVAAQQYLSGIVMHMLGMVQYVAKNKLFEVGDVEKKIARAKIIMQENLCKEIDPEILAEKLNLSYSWFRKEFKNYTGYAPARYFQELKIGKAKELLVATSQPVKEIAFQLGYGSTEHFSTLFKKRTGYTPLEYRYYGRENEIGTE